MGKGVAWWVWSVHELLCGACSQGLGKESQGRVEPVEIVILPAGKSLDVCAQLREERKVKIVDGLKKKRKRKSKLAAAATEGPTDMFEFLNTKVFTRGKG